MKTTRCDRSHPARTTSCRLAAVLLAGLAVAGIVVACGGSSAPSAPRRSPAAPGTGPATASPAPSTAASAAAPGQPTIVLLGGSSARECIVSNASWAAQMKQLGGGSVSALDLGASNETYAQDSVLMKALPRAPTIVLIGVSVGRYTSAPPAGGTTTASPDAIAAMSPGHIVKHRYTTADVKSLTSKKTLLHEWVSQRYPVFSKNYATNAADLETLVKTCLARDFHPVVLQLPLNLEVIGHAFDPAVSAYGADCQKLADRYNIPWVDFVAATRLPSGDFYDLMHLVEAGRTKWQKQLSSETVKLLRQYGLTTG